MTSVSEIYNFLCEIAPLKLAESYDNPGLLVGDSDVKVTKAMLSLDVTSRIAEEAKSFGAQLVISHHPVIFNPVKKILAHGATSAIWKLAGNSISAICMHTNLDAADGGVNDALAFALNLADVTGFNDGKTENYKKVVVFVPTPYAEKIRRAMAEAGAGKLGNYDGCAFETHGSGYFRPLAGANPFIGESGKQEKTDEVRIEAVCAPEDVNRVISKMIKVHPYEVPAYDVFEDEAVCKKYGIGRIGQLEKTEELKDFAKKVKRLLGAGCVKVTDAGKPVKRVAVCGGAVDEQIIENASKAGADTLVTGEMKHHLYYAALERELNIVEAGHFATETVILPTLEAKLAEKFPDVVFQIAKGNREPYYVV